MEKNVITAFVRTMADLPHAFDFNYWSMGDTTYKEQIFIAFVEQNKVPISEAEKIAYKCGFSKRNNVVLFLLLRGEAEERMGMTIGLTPKAERKLDKVRGYN